MAIALTTAPRVVNHRFVSRQQGENCSVIAWFLVLAIGLGAPTKAQASSTGPLISAATSVRFALEDLAQVMERETTRKVRFVFGSSGNLARQIREGAPYELYLAADPRYVEELAHDGFTRDRGKDYLLGHLALVVPRGSPLAADGTLGDLRAALAEKRVKRFAIANPAHAPYGQRAEQALRYAGLWRAIQTRLVIGENVGQAAQFAVSGNAEGGIIGFGLAQVPTIATRSTAARIPSEWHDPLRHRAVLLKSAGAGALQFYHFLGSADAQRVFAKHGFALPNQPN